MIALFQALNAHRPSHSSVLRRNCLAVFVMMLLWQNSQACQCPLTTLSLKECDKYELIFKGRVDSVKNCDGKFGQAFFKIEELYKGNATENFTVLFECGGECATGFNAGEEWVIYTRYKQINNALMDWCSRSRKYFKFDKEDFYAETYGNDYEDEVKFLREKLKLHRLLKDENKQEGNRNELPGINQIIILLLCSIAVIVGFLVIVRRMKS